jgi:hypothetical protein
MHDSTLSESVGRSRSSARPVAEDEDQRATADRPLRAGAFSLEVRSRYASARKPLNVDPLRFCLQPPTARERQTLIAERAYFRALKRGFLPGHELEDWLAAETEVDQLVEAPRRNDD